ncbi:UDP-glycosyltransferase 90A2-like [Oryza glaberrima]|uniref:Glycosyltransferase n=1 Tax=Oryza glaberrima TaxID=4538 RepID=I1PK14_ORYGL|nr:UDP-glycosyltransferase 90A2-like [Oryza glaberrima]
MAAAGHDGQLPHVAIFPFMARGHTVPMTHLACLLRRRCLAAVTFFTTPGNAPFVRGQLDDDVAVVELPFPDHVVARGAAEGVEALDSLFPLPAFVEAVSALRPGLEASLAAARPRVGLLVADAFLHWAHASAAALGVPTVAFLGGNMFATIMRDVILRDNPAAALLSGGGGAEAATFAVPEFPHVHLTLADIPVPFNHPSPEGPIMELNAKLGKAIAGSNGLIVNTFDAMEGRYVEHWNRDHRAGHRAWPIGPLCLAHGGIGTGTGAVEPSWMKWLDEKAAAGRAVLYVALGTAMAIPDAQLREVAGGLEAAAAAGVDFLWAVRPSDADLGAGFEERVEGRGMVVREWVDQWRILQHGCVRGFLSHCGWNSAVEGVAAGVPLAAWPMGAEQPLNAMLVVDELRVGVRVPPAPATATGGHGGLVGSEVIARVARELMMMVGEGKGGGGEAARNVAALAAKAREAVAEGGSSWKALEEMVATLCRPVEADTPFLPK